MRKDLCLWGCLFALVLTPALSVKPVAGSVGPQVDNERYGRVHSLNNTADHSKFLLLQQEFTSGPQVTAACLSCHTEAARQVHKTIHWTWLCPAAAPEARLGKGGHALNNFCINIGSNEPRCTSCHAGYGWRDKSFDFTAQDRVDCLVCHEQTGTYEKFPTMAGMTVEEPTPFGGRMWHPPDWNLVAQSVGRPTRKNCGACHFYGGGGEGVKHGDLDASLLTPERNLDVHMAADGRNFTCTRCHTTEQHAIAGRCYKSTELSDRRSLLQDDQIKRITCYSCHSTTPHPPGMKANDHTDKVACQTCHIPQYARKHSTKMSWDWSTAGQMGPDGKPVVRHEDGRPVYDSRKGDFVWASHVEPEYFWFNGKLTYVTLTDRIDPSSPVLINAPVGSYDDPNARIYPFKVHRGKQPYDKQNNTFLAPHLFGKGDAAYWSNFDWEKSIETGMRYMELPYSGEMGFVETEYVLQTTHMVAPREQSLRCDECHSRDGRLGNLEGFYIPGRDRHKALDFMGWSMVLASLLGVTIHGALRFIRRKQ